MSERKASRTASPPAAARGLRWFRSWSRQREFRPRCAYFRPLDTVTLDIPMMKLIERQVTVRLVRIADAGTPYAGEGLYRILTKGASRTLRPERDFDFLE